MSEPKKTTDREKVPVELTIRAILLGIVLSMLLAGTNAYLGLFAGMTVSASIPAAVLSMGIFRLFRRSSILENNIVQTSASAGESLAAGAIFTLPALLILGFWDEIHLGWVMLLCGLGGVLGVLFTIPLRRSLILQQKLQFPEGVATAEVLETGQTGGRGLTYIIQAAAAGGLFKLGSTALGVWPDAIETARRVGNSIFYGGTNLSPALASVGYIVGLNIAVLIFLGGAVNWLVAIPIVSTFESASGQTLIEQAYSLWSGKTRYIGVGAMVFGGLWTIFQIRKTLLSGIVSGLKAYQIRTSGQPALERTEKDVPMKWVLLLILLLVVPLLLVYQVFVANWSISITMAVCMLITGFVFSAVAGYMAGLVGSSNNPVSGVTIATVLISALLLAAMMGAAAEHGPAAAIVIGTVVCCAAAIAGDNMQDLKTGVIVGATPWRQQIMQMVGTVSAAVVLGPVLMLLDRAYGFAGTERAGVNALAAPQANLMASVARGVFSRQLPWNYILIGIAAAVVIIILDEIQRKRNSAFRLPVLAVAIGIYLPFELSVPIFAGGLIRWAVEKRHAAAPTGPNDPAALTANSGLLFASGLITGEALMGVLLAIPIAALKPAGIAFPLFAMPLGGWVGSALLAGICVWMYTVATGRK
ncbi:MAG TPA: oligopeptide transporter, OPT family [Phycisphaerales bacterium]|nr:oligopeptide transporter, OPT family [Phycisphaerales bacterium]